MPNISLQYSTNLPRDLDWRALALKIHEEVSSLVAAPIDRFRTQLQPVDGYLIADGSESKAYVYTELKLLPGRSQALRSEVGQHIHRLITEMLAPVATDLDVRVAVEVIEIDAANYHLTS